MLLALLVTFIVALAVAFVITPRPATAPAMMIKPPPPRPALPEPEPDYDPSAFWLYPDWDSGPADEPFWMRPLKVPVRFDNRPNYGGFTVMPKLWGGHQVPGVLIWTGDSAALRDARPEEAPAPPLARRAVSATEG